MNKLVNGRIPANTICPYKDECRTSVTCWHKGKDHPNPFSCALARGLELISKREEK